MRLGYLLLIMLFGFCSGVAHAQSSTDKAIGAPRFENVSTESLSAAGFVPSQSRGVFVGINDFDDESVTDLKFACDDAVDLAFRFYELGLIRADGIAIGLAGQPGKPESVTRLATLRERGMVEPFNPTRSEILKRVGIAARTSGKEGLLVMTLSTHGFYERGDALFSRDTTADLDLESGILTETSLSYDSLVQLMLRSPSPRRLALVDACRERLQQGGTKSIGRDPALPAALAQRLSQTKGIAMILGAPPGGYGYDGGEDDSRQPIRNGVFTHYLLKGLSGEAPGEAATGFVTLGSLLDYTQSHLSKWTTQNGRPIADGGAGISFRELDRALMDLPLAVDAGRAERLRDLEQRRIKARTLLAQAFAAEPNIVTAVILGEVTTALGEWDADRAEPLVLAIERLEAGTPESRRYFVKVDWDSLRPTTATPTVTPMATPAPTQVAATTRTRTVAADGSTPYASIGAAMAESTSGDSIVVKPGTYRELVLMKSGVRLIGSGPEITRVEVQSGQRSALLAEGCTDASVENIAFDGKGFKNLNAWSAGLSLVWRNDRMEVEKVDAGGPAETLGIAPGDVVTRLRGRTPASGDEWPLAFEFGAAAVEGSFNLETMRDGVAQSHRIIPMLVPVVEQQAHVNGAVILRSTITFSNVTVQDFTADGIQLAGSECRAILRDTTSQGNGKHGAMVVQGSELIAEDSFFRNNKSTGFFISGEGSKGDARRVRSSLNGVAGFYVRDSASATVTDSFAEDNEDSGVQSIEPGSVIVVNESQLLRNGKTGASVTSGAEMQVIRCIAEANGTEGVSAWTPGTRIAVINSNMRLNKGRGLYVSDNAQGRVEGSLAHMNEQGGIRIGGTEDFSISSSEVTYNTGDGLSISPGSVVRVSTLTAEKNNEDGIAIWGEGTRVTLSACSSKESTRYGFFASNGATADFADCTATSNTKAGFALASKANVTLVDCQAFSNVDNGFTVWTEAVVSATRCLAKESTTGFNVSATSLFTLKECTAEGNATRGYLAFGTGARMMATGCKALASDPGNGFVVGGGASGEFNACESLGNKDTGFFAYTLGSSITVRSCLVKEARHGIWLQENCTGTITGNTVTECIDWGIMLHGLGTVAAVNGNTLTDNGNGNNISISDGATNTTP
jgi:hypothetical protein